MNHQSLALPNIPTISREPSWDEWIAYGEELATHQARLDQHITNYRFVVAVWYEYGVEHWRRPAERIAREIGFDPETIQNWAWVARKTNLLRSSSPRGDDGLEYEHFRVLAAVKDTKLQAELAERAKREGLSGAQLRAEVKRLNGKAGDSARDSAHGGDVRADKIEQLISALCEEGAALLEHGDQIAQAQADVKLDCAARLREILR